MATTRNNILAYLKDQLAGLSGMHAERVLVGVAIAGKLGPEPVIGIIWMRDRGMRKDGHKSERQLSLFVCAIVKLDSIKAEAQLVQLSEFFDPVQAALEELSDGDLNKQVLQMKEDDGVVPGGFEDLDSYAYVGSSWTIDYERARAAS